MEILSFSNLIVGLILVSSIPIGFLIAWHSRDELVQGKTFFILLMSVSLLLSLGGVFWNRYDLSLTGIYAAIVGFIAFFKGKDKDWTKKKI